MKEFIDKLIERLEEEHERCINRYGIVGGNAPAMEVKQCMDIVTQLAEEYKEDCCEWKQYDENDIYYTWCEQIHMFIDGSPTDNKYEFCPYCGKKIKVAPYTKGE